MSLLLDTHVILWWLAGDPALPQNVRARLEDEPGVYFSPVSVWEITIKQAKGKLSGPAGLAESVRDSGFTELPITVEHAIAAGRLPPVHHDPFDRMLVAQARWEGLTLVSHDPQIRSYDVDLLPS